jgi:hypothetical protein
MEEDDEKLANRQDESAYLGEYEAGTYLTSKNTFCTQATTLISTFIPTTLFRWGANREKDCVLYQSLKFRKSRATRRGDFDF